MSPQHGDPQAASGGRRNVPPGTETLTQDIIDLMYSLPNHPTGVLVVPIPRSIPESIRRMAVESCGFEYRRPALMDFAINLGRLAAP